MFIFFCFGPFCINLVQDWKCPFWKNLVHKIKIVNQGKMCYKDKLEDAGFSGDAFLSKAEVWCQGFPQCGKGGLEDPPTNQNISLSPSLSPLLCPRNLDFVILMQFLAILSKLSPFHKSTPDRKPWVPRKISIWRNQSWCARFWLGMPQKSNFGPKIQNC